MKTMSLNEQEPQEATRLFNLRRRIYDHRNLKDWPENGDNEDFDADIDGVEIRTKRLTDQDIFALVVISKDLYDYGTQKRDFSFLGWKPQYIASLAKKEKAIRCDTLFNPDTGTIAGKGYIISGVIRRAMNDMYDEHLWNPLPILKTISYRLLLFIEIPDVYTGVAKLEGMSEDQNKVEISRPSHLRYDQAPNWEKDDKGHYKQTVTIGLDYVKKWRVS